MKSVVEHLSNLIRIPSNSALSNRPVVDYARRVLETAGWSARLFPWRDPQQVEKVNMIAAPSGQDVTLAAVGLAFVCHTDTVPFAADWSRALDPYVSDGLLHGCGSCDVKGFLACLLTAASTSSQVADGVRIVLTADEEVGCIGAGHLLSETRLRPRRAVVGEPTSLQPARAGKGYCLAEITVRGKEAHSAHPQQGISAIHHAARLILAIEEYSQQLEQEQNCFFDPGWTTINIGTIQGGTAKNIVPGLCRLQLEWRPIPGQSADTVLQAVTALIERLRATHSGFDAAIRPIRQQPGFETPADAGLVRQMEQLTGKAAVSIPFGSEASLLAPLAREVVVFGAGDMRTAHSSRECVPLAELDLALEVVRTLMRDE